DPQLVRPDAVDRRDGATQDVVAPLELAGALDRDDVLVLLDHTEHGRVPPRVATDAALLFLGDVEAGRAELDPGLDLQEHLGETAYVRLVGLEQVEGDPLSTLRPHAREPTELVDPILNHAL